MKFDRLNASIHNNRNEEPTLYMAFCMIESLFADMEAATGKDLSRCAMGDDAFPIKMRWLSRCILDIFKDQHEELSSRPRMADAMKKLADTQKELDGLAEIAQEQAAAQAELRQLQNVLQLRKEKEAEFVRLTGEIERANRQIEMLEKYDPASVQRDLQERYDRIDRLKKEQKDLQDKEACAAREQEELQQSIAVKNAQLNDLRQRTAQLTNQINQIQSNSDQLLPTLSDLEKQYNELLRKSDSSVAKREDLCNKIRDLQRQLEPLEADLSRLLPDLEAREDRKQRLKGQIEEAEKQSQLLDTEILELNGKLRLIRDELPTAEAKREGLMKDLSDVVAQKDNLASEIKRMQDLMAVYEETELCPLRQKKEAIKRDLDRLEDQRQVLQQEQEDFAGQRDKLIVDIGHQKAARDDMNESILGIQANLTQLEQEVQRLRSSRTGMLARLSAMQTEVDSLQTQKLPEIDALVRQEQTRRDGLIGKIEQSKLEKKALQEEIAALEQKLPDLDAQLPPLTEKLNATRAIYDALVAKVTAGTEDLRKLEDKIKEMRDQNDEEKYRIYRKQLEEDLRKLDELRGNLVATQEKIQDLDGELIEKQQELARLQEQKEKYEAGCKATDSLLLKLAPVATSDYVRQTAAVSQQLKLLENVRCRLVGSVNTLHIYLGKTAFDDSLSLDSCFKVTLQELKSRTEELHNALMGCTNSLKMEEQ